MRGLTHSQFTNSPMLTAVRGIIQNSFGSAQLLNQHFNFDKKAMALSFPDFSVDDIAEKKNDFVQTIVSNLSRIRDEDIFKEIPLTLIAQFKNGTATAAHVNELNDVAKKVVAKLINDVFILQNKKHKIVLKNLGYRK
jgi:tagatose-1,6-bisphosphate aldolase non-catalytic subunit AgaZ/GatZ